MSYNDKISQLMDSIFRVMMAKMLLISDFKCPICVMP